MWQGLHLLLNSPSRDEPSHLRPGAAFYIRTTGGSCKQFAAHLRSCISPRHYFVPALNLTGSDLGKVVRLTAGSHPGQRFSPPIQFQPHARFPALSHCRPFPVNPSWPRMGRLVPGGHSTRSVVWRDEGAILVPSPDAIHAGIRARMTPAQPRRGPAFPAGLFGASAVVDCSSDEQAKTAFYYLPRSPTLLARQSLGPQSYRASLSRFARREIKGISWSNTAEAESILPSGFSHGMPRADPTSRQRFCHGQQARQSVRCGPLVALTHPQAPRGRRWI